MKQWQKTCKQCGKHVISKISKADLENHKCYAEEPEKKKKWGKDSAE